MWFLLAFTLKSTWIARDQGGNHLNFGLLSVLRVKFWFCLFCWENNKFSQEPFNFSDFWENLTLLNVEWKFQINMEIHTATIILQMKNWGLKYLV